LLEVILDKTHDVVWNIILLFTGIFTIPFALSRKWFFKFKDKKITINESNKND
jgi:Na+/H+ antiporter NhaD/arsenite permease-like protein